MDTARRRSFLLVCTALASLLVVAACGDDDQGSPSLDAATAAPTAPDEPVETPPAAEDGEAEERPVLGSAAVLSGFEGLDRLDGGRFESDELVGEGEPVVLWFWAPWCPTCRAIAPTVAALAGERDLRIVGVAGQGTVEEMGEFTTSTRTDQLVHVVDPDGAAWAEFGVLTQPTFALVAPDGTVDLLVRPGRDQLVERIDALHGG